MVLTPLSVVMPGTKPWEQAVPPGWPALHGCHDKLEEYTVWQLLSPQAGGVHQGEDLCWTGGVVLNQHVLVLILRPTRRLEVRIKEKISAGVQGQIGIRVK